MRQCTAHCWKELRGFRLLAGYVVRGGLVPLCRISGLCCVCFCSIYQPVQKGYGFAFASGYSRVVEGGVHSY